MSTRESKRVRERGLALGISQISGGSKTSVGGYEKPEREEKQHLLNLIQVISEVWMKSLIGFVH